MQENLWRNIVGTFVKKRNEKNIKQINTNTYRITLVVKNVSVKKLSEK